MMHDNLSHPLNSPTINVMYRALSKVTPFLIRDFGEIENLQMSHKGPGNFASQIDQRIEKLVHAALEKTRPGYPFLGEELGHIPGKNSEYMWVFDPIDGTNNFLHGYPHFCMSLALLKNKETIAGMTYDPLKDEVFYALKGEGAYERHKRLRVSKRETLKTALGITSGLLRHPDIQRFKHAMTSLSCVRQTGSSALDLAYLAAGRADVFWSEKLEPWDFLVGALMVEEAGGCVTNFKKQKVKTETTSLIAGNFTLHDQLFHILNTPIPDQDPDF